MTIAAAITWILSNTGVILFVVALIVTIVKVRRAHFARRVVTTSYVLWGEMLFYVLGIGSIYAGLMHAYAQWIVAPSIGWVPSPFEYELGWAEVALGIVALMSLWRGYEFRLATTIVAFVFGWSVAAQHLHEMIYAHNYAPGNAGIILWFGDIAFPLFVVMLAWLSREAHERTERTY
ncbi:MAG TPA: DUF6790 family protein [Verrucomicrobiae bacterium]|jgi:hypothetical protein|nr:DUF6790 family protein [Verrucomicrobiae bacterium]